jgi:hypothetical protein
MPEIEQDKKSQRENFIETARDIGYGEDEAAFRDRLKTLVAEPSSAPKLAEKAKTKQPAK